MRSVLSATPSIRLSSDSTRAALFDLFDGLDGLVRGLRARLGAVRRAAGLLRDLVGVRGYLFDGRRQRPEVVRRGLEVARLRPQVGGELADVFGQSLLRPFERLGVVVDRLGRPLDVRRERPQVHDSRGELSLHLAERVAYLVDGRDVGLTRRFGGEVALRHRLHRVGEFVRANEQSFVQFLDFGLGFLAVLCVPNLLSRLLSGAFDGEPVRHQRRGEAEEERRVDEPPPHGSRDGVRVVVHRLRVRHAEDAVFDGHVQHARGEREPVLVDGDDADHDEEVEVRLDVAPREVDQDGRGRHQPDGDDASPNAPRELRNARHRRQRDDDADAGDQMLERNGGERRTRDVRLGPGETPERVQERRVGREQQYDVSVARPPGLLRDGVPSRDVSEEVPYRPSYPTHPRISGSPARVPVRHGTLVLVSGKICDGPKISPDN
jgi:hypothetical protein